MTQSTARQIGIIGGGPAALFMVKRLLETGQNEIGISIFEQKQTLGAGMPYSEHGAGVEHITNVSDNEIPKLNQSIQEWLHEAPALLLKQYHITPQTFNEYKVVPRLLFGAYLHAQFEQLLKIAKQRNISVQVHLNTAITDIIQKEKSERFTLTTAKDDDYHFDQVVICTGHCWPTKHEGKVQGWFDSPYPPTKLFVQANYPVAIKGASLTAIDAVRTLARRNGQFMEDEEGKLLFTLNDDAPEFRLALHSLDGLLPAIRFHLQDSQLSKNSVLTQEEVQEVMENNDGFIPLDYIFNRNFKQPLRERNPQFYEKISGMNMEAFVDYMMSFRESLDAITLFKAEYAEAEKSIRRRQSVEWKEELAVLSYAMNYPAKHLSAEDMLRLKKVLMPLIAIVIAFVPQSSCREIMALHDAGVLTIVPVDKQSRVEPDGANGAVYHFTNDKGELQTQHYAMYVDAVGQPHFQFEEFPFAGLRASGAVSAARLKFRDAAAAEKMLEKKEAGISKDAAGDYWLRVPGIGVNDQFQVLDEYGAFNSNLYIMAVPHIGGLNPDYSGLDFCERASEKIAEAMCAEVSAERIAS